MLPQKVFLPTKFNLKHSISSVFSIDVYRVLFSDLILLKFLTSLAESGLVGILLYSHFDTGLTPGDIYGHF